MGARKVVLLLLAVMTASAVVAADKDEHLHTICQYIVWKVWHMGCAEMAPCSALALCDAVFIEHAPCLKDDAQKIITYTDIADKTWASRLPAMGEELYQLSKGHISCMPIFEMADEPCLWSHGCEPMMKWTCKHTHTESEADKFIRDMILRVECSLRSAQQDNNDDSDSCPL